VNLKRVTEKRDRKSAYFGCVGRKAGRERKIAGIKELSRKR